MCTEIPYGPDRDRASLVVSIWSAAVQESALQAVHDGQRLPRTLGAVIRERRRWMEAPRRGPRRKKGWARLRHPRRHAHPDRPARRRPAVLVRQAPEARDEPAGHRQPRRGHRVGRPGRYPGRRTTRRRNGSGACWPSWKPPAWSSWPLGLPGQHVREDPGPGQEQARIPEAGQ